MGLGPLPPVIHQIENPYGKLLKEHQTFRQFDNSSSRRELFIVPGSIVVVIRM